MSERFFRVTEVARSTNQFTKTVRSCPEKIPDELTLLLAETQEKLFRIGLKERKP